MTEAIKQQLREKGLPVPGENRPKNRPHAPTAAPSHTDTGEALREQQARNSPHETGKDAPPARPAAVPLLWQRATGQFATDFPAAFRVVVVGAVEDWPKVEAALDKVRKELLGLAD